jgi:peptide chain release factor 1
MEKDIRIYRLRASTRGGQRANSKETGVRILHVPSGIQAKILGRSQSQNLKTALELLGERIAEKNRPVKKRVPTRVSRGAKEKRIRTKKQLSQKKKLRRTSFQTE